MVGTGVTLGAVSFAGAVLNRTHERNLKQRLALRAQEIEAQIKAKVASKGKEKMQWRAERLRKNFGTTRTAAKMYTTAEASASVETFVTAKDYLIGDEPSTTETSLPTTFYAVCAEDLDPIEFPTAEDLPPSCVSCCQNVCEWCLRESLTNDIINKSLKHIGCPICPQAWPHHYVNLHAKAETLDIHYKKESLHLLETLPEWSICQSPACQSGQLHSSG